MNLDESRQEFIRHMERMMGRPLTRQEINMAILQAEQIGDLWSQGPALPVRHRVRVRVVELCDAVG